MTAEHLADGSKERQAEWANWASRNFEHVPAADPAQFAYSVVMTHDLAGLIDFAPEDLRSDSPRE